MRVSTASSSTCWVAGMAFLVLFATLISLVESFTLPTPAFSARASPAAAASKAPPQVLEFREPRTNVTVVLVGAMHYNPTSIRLAADTVQELAEKDALGSVIIESCDVRWNKTEEFYSTQQGKIFKEVLTNEMRTASDMAMLYGRPVVLGDQRINVTGDRIKDALGQTLKELASPLGGGWKRFYDSVAEAVKIALPSGPAYMDASGFLDLRLLLTAPVSFFKYPLSFLVRSPVAAVLFFSLLLGLELFGPDDGDYALLFSPDVPIVERISDLAGSLAFACLETAVFVRLLVQTLLAERNEVLAKNILEQCKIYASSNSDRPFEMPRGLSFLPNTWFGFRPWANAKTIEAPVDTDIVYAPNSTFTDERIRQDGDKVVVAVLGMAHCNGIMKLLQEQRV